MEQVFENWKGYLLTESSLSRVYEHMLEHDTAILSAERDEHNNKENRVQSNKLEAIIRYARYGYTTQRGSYIENFTLPTAVKVSEKSLFVVNLKDAPNFFEHITDLSEEFGQDSVLLIPKGAKGAYLVGTKRGAPFPSYEEIMPVGDFKAGKEAEYMTKTSGRPYTFKEELVVYETLSRNQRWALSLMIEQYNTKKKK